METLLCWLVFPPITRPTLLYGKRKGAWPALNGLCRGTPEVKNEWHCTFVAYAKKKYVGHAHAGKTAHDARRDMKRASGLGNSLSLALPKGKKKSP